MTVHNKTHVSLQQISSDRVSPQMNNCLLFYKFDFGIRFGLKGGLIVDEFTIIKELHGPEAWK